MTEESICSCKNQQFSLSTCNPLNSCFIHTSNAALFFPSMQRWGSFIVRPVDNCVSGFSHFMLFFPLSKKREMIFGELQATRQSTRLHQSAQSQQREERHDVSAGITSRWAPSKAKVSGQISSYNGQDDKRQPQSDAVLNLIDTIGGCICGTFSLIKPSNLEFY